MSPRGKEARKEVRQRIRKRVEEKMRPLTLPNFITLMFKCQVLPIFTQWAGKCNSIKMCR